MHNYCAIHRISQAVQVTDSSESIVIMVTPKGEYILTQGDSENLMISSTMRPVQETNPTASSKLIL